MCLPMRPRLTYSELFNHPALWLCHHHLSKLLVDLSHYKPVGSVVKAGAYSDRSHYVPKAVFTRSNFCKPVYV